jgi:hypothetical protein
MIVHQNHENCEFVKVCGEGWEQGPAGSYMIAKGATVRSMMAKKKATPDTSIRQAELIVKLYELRRETVMREARSYVGGEFMPASADEFVGIVSGGGRQSSFVLQVYGYWDMVAAFVRNGALNAGLVYSTCTEMYFQYAKIQPYLAEFREKMNLPEFLISVERVIEGTKAGRERLLTMKKNLAAIAEARRLKLEWLRAQRPPLHK